MSAAGAFLAVGLPGTELDATTAKILRRVQPGGVILLPRNIADEPQLRALVAAIKATVPGALLYLDAEGGRVDRLRNIVGGAPAGETMAAKQPAFARRSGRWVGASLAAFGFDVDLAPVVDLDFGFVNNALDRRCLGATPRQVVARARAFIRGLEGAGVGACLKHFPGLGRAGEDTHFEGTVIRGTLEDFAADLAPFRELGSLAGAVMVNHAKYPDLDPEGRPATVSPAIATDLLRRELRFRGLAYSDDLDMQALEPWGDPPERAAAAFAAGCDVLFLCHSLESAPAAASKLARPSLAARRDEAAARIRSFRRRLERLKREAPLTHLAPIRRRLARLDRSPDSSK